MDDLQGPLRAAALFPADTDPAHWAARFAVHAGNVPTAFVGQPVLAAWFGAAILTGRKAESEKYYAELLRLKRTLTRVTITMSAVFGLLLAAVLLMLTGSVR